MRKVIDNILALTPDATAESFIFAALKTYATKVKDTRKDQNQYNLEWRNLAILTLKELENETA